LLATKKHKMNKNLEKIILCFLCLFVAKDF
jgi:hypothetical protein